MRGKWILLLAVLVLAGLIFFGPLIPSWLSPYPERFNGRVRSFDMAGGRLRSERFLLYIHLRDKVSESDLTRRYRRLVGEPPAARWVTTDISTPWMDACCIGVGPASVSVELSSALGAAEFTEEAERATVKEFFRLLELGQNDPRLGNYEEYARKVTILSTGNQRTPITLEMLKSATSQLD